jgi:succinyl-diaminopimelate desuccinylase
VTVDGLVYREGLNAVGIHGGVAGNVIPDQCEVLVNYRFAPDQDLAQAEHRVRQIFADWPVEVRDAAPPARPGLDDPLVAALVRRVGTVRPKYGWTDVARFAQLGIPAVNFGPGDPDLCHTDHEFVFLDQIRSCRDTLRQWLAADQDQSQPK